MKNGKTNDAEKGCLVAIEGIDGSGKTLLTDNLLQHFRSKRFKVCATKEPGRNLIGRTHRKLSLMKNINPYAAALISTADRYFKLQFVTGKISKGFLVISDRYYLSGLAYHFADGISFEDYAYLNRRVVKPDLYVFLEIKAENALRRIKKTRDRWEAMLEKLPFCYHEALRFLESVEKGYIVRVNAEASPGEVVEQAVAAIQLFLRR